MNNVFKGVKVLELAGVLAGPSVGMFFAELGAEVIKVENKRVGGEVTRNWKLPSEDRKSSVSAYFSSVNYLKDYLMLDLSDQADLNTVRDLAHEADVVIANFREGSAKKYKLDYGSINEQNPGVIYSHLRGYMADRKRPAFDVVLQAETGWMSINGEPDGKPLKMPVALMDLLAAHHMKQSILIALFKRASTGKGAYIECTLEGSAISNLANQASNYLMTGEVPQQLGSLHPNIAPYGEMFQTSDNKWIILAIGSDGQFASLCEMLGTFDLVGDERFRTNPQRVINRTELAAILSPLFTKRSSDEWIQLMTDLSIPAGVVRSIDEVFSFESVSDLVRVENIDGMNTKRVTSTPFTIRFES